MSDAGGRPPHAVLLRAPSRFDTKAVAAVLSGHSRLPAESWIPVVRRGWGILAEPSSAEEAEALAAALTAAGHPAVAVPVALLEEPPAATLVTKAELSGDGFDILAGRAGAEVQRLVWTHLKVLSAGAVSETGRKTVTEGPSAGEKAVRLGATLVTGIPMMGGKTKTRQVIEERRIPFIELLFAAPARRVRILAAEFDYTVLGPKMSYSAELNFRALVSELAARAPAALRGKGARAILAKAPSGELAYESFDDVQREERWLAALDAL
ncbi:MAG: hypothetical protein PHS14_19930, partial [Elusimicrobia bacterium]|nr:hypothetical protein [Elusimicrobiota bacterium]